jgi:hypothetical protein
VRPSAEFQSEATGGSSGSGRFALTRSIFSDLVGSVLCSLLDWIGFVRTWKGEEKREGKRRGGIYICDMDGRGRGEGEEEGKTDFDQ